MHQAISSVIFHFASQRQQSCDDRASAGAEDQVEMITKGVRPWASLPLGDSSS
jgi:hypothetical protein